MNEILKLDHVTMQFGGLTAVNNFNNHVREGEILGLIGPNGAGKTTVFNVVTGVYYPTKGKVLFNGLDITSLKPHHITHVGISRTFQNIRLFQDMTVLDNVMVAQHHEIATKDAEKYLVKIGKNKYGANSTWFWRSVFKLGYLRREKEMKDKALNILEKLGLRKLAAEKASSLPYGEQRLLEIARALATDAKLLLLDEPAAGMNPSESQQLVQLIKWIRDEFKVTIFIIEHDMKVVMGLCERILVMDYGVLIAEGTPDEIQENKKVIEAYLGEEWSHVAE
ncbi:MAG: ABC transporter ATP-binding protein [Kosmotoga sp.]|uniref:ABC transporter ATP-binding protein n=1 Tax=Kosmotoga sp. TaxID=1955248 RepID=UPI0025BA0C06|nr:ABC transporter ATP-binding protein [Kosmotoga sp.]MCD6160659.1 ABC transporter ATP-binding protein [Kosmotoga sp.]